MGARGDSRSSGSNLRGWTLVRGWVVMIGLAMMLHFGLFRWLSAFWTRRGVDAPPLMDAPLRSASLSDFWGRRWNRAFRDLGHDLLFRPAAARYGASAAMLLTFLASGLIHELVISLPAGGGFGGPTAYFALQAAGIALERSPVGARLGMRGGIAGRGIALAIVMGPAVVLFHPPFVHRVITPFAQAIGAW